MFVFRFVSLGSERRSEKERNSERKREKEREREEDET